MNKYNVRAIRNEIEGYIRHCAWKKFRIRFQSLSNDLQMAIVEYRPKQTSSGHKKHKSLLHALCHSCSPNVHPPVPVDLLEMVLKASSISTHAPTPLSIALNRQAHLTVLECLLMHSNSSLLLHSRDGKGDTPILQAVKQQQDNVDVWKLLLKYDKTKNTLLVPSKKRNRVPLFYVAHHELSFLGDTGDEIPEELGHILLQTYQAIKIQQGRKVDVDNSVESDDHYQNVDDYNSLDDSWEEDDSKQLLNLLHATIACAHFLGTKNTGKLLQFFLSRQTEHFSLLDMLDSEGNNLLHHLCQAEQVFSIEPIIQIRTEHKEQHEITLLQHLLDFHPQGIFQENSDGRLPLHVAIECHKDWIFLKKLGSNGTWIGSI